MDQICKNCGNSFTKNYCNDCGQKYDVPRFTFKHIFEEALHAFTHADKSFLSFARKLIIDPGGVAREYIIEKKRKSYFNPFTFFLLSTAIAGFVEGMDLNLKDKLFNDNNEYGHIFNVYSKILFLAVIPIFAFFTWLLHLKKPRLRYSEYTVYAMFIICLYNILELFIHTINYCFTALLKSRVEIGDNLVFVILFTLYIAYADTHFHMNIQKKSWTKGIISGIVFFLVEMAVGIFVIYGIINEFKGLGNLEFFGIHIK
ncbi:MAG: DUF3667 domain-containing protein [Bacteroidota bacterium]